MRTYCVLLYIICLVCLALSLCLKYSTLDLNIISVLCDRLLKYVLSVSKAKVVFVATDRHPMISDIEQHFKKKKVAVLFYHGLPPVLC